MERPGRAKAAPGTGAQASHPSSDASLGPVPPAITQAMQRRRTEMPEAAARRDERPASRIPGQTSRHCPRLAGPFDVLRSPSRECTKSPMGFRKTETTGNMHRSGRHPARRSRFGQISCYVRDAAPLSHAFCLPRIRGEVRHPVARAMIPRPMRASPPVRKAAAACRPTLSCSPARDGNEAVVAHHAVAGREPGPVPGDPLDAATPVRARSGADDSRRRLAGRAGIDARRGSLDHVLGLQPSHPLPRRGAGQAHDDADTGQARPAIAFEDGNNLLIDVSAAFAVVLVQGNGREKSHTQVCSAGITNGVGSGTGPPPDRRSGYGRAAHRSRPRQMPGRRSRRRRPSA